LVRSFIMGGKSREVSRFPALPKHVNNLMKLVGGFPSDNLDGGKGYREALAAPVARLVV